MTRQQKIDKGLIWQVYPDGNIDSVLFEGTKTDCRRYIRVNCPAAYKNGDIRIGKLIYEPIKTN